MWKVDGKRISSGQSSGKWCVGVQAMADGEPGDTISMNSSRAVSNSVTGNVGIPIRTLNLSFQFNVVRQWSADASKTYGLSGKKKGTWWEIRYKRVFSNYKLRVREYSFYDGTWHKTKHKKWIRAKKFSHFAYKLSPSTAPKKAMRAACLYY